MSNSELEVLGIPSLCTLLLEQYEDWQISEKWLCWIQQDIPTDLQNLTTVHGSESIYVHKNVQKMSHIDSDGVEY